MVRDYNSGNGIIGGLAAPLLAWWLWTLAASWWLMGRPRMGEAVRAPALRGT